ncbi:hypothetical protein [Streptomyces albus]|uniref:hypothetical protein n=1 Tax=unclassified Streptomyces TaxID=2593676 RepID=UPI00131DA74B|nr:MULTISPECIES: hypothetical protein [unclassified Streptomyces]
MALDSPAEDEPAQDPLAVLRAAIPELEAETMPQALAEIGSVTEAIPYRWLFWPAMIEVAGAVFVDLYGAGEEEIKRRLRAACASGGVKDQSGWNRLVASFNYFEIGNIFSSWRGSQDSDEQVQLALAESLIEPWNAKISALFPESRAKARIAAPDPTLGVCIEVLQDSPVPPSGSLLP